MKKFFALALCALMMVSLAATAFAAEDAFSYNFEDDGEGEFIAIDNSLKVSPKQFSITVAKIGDTMAMKYDRSGYQEGAGDKDCFSDLFTGGTNTFGLESKFVLSYDINFEKLTDTEASQSQWQVAMLRMTPPAGTQFQQSAMVVGNQLIPNGAEEGVMTLEENKWYNFAVAFDMDNKSMSVYVDGVLVADSLDWTVADTSMNVAERVRIAWNASSGDASADGIAYVDNIRAYNAEKPDNATGKTLETSAPVTEAPATEAPATDAATQAAPATTPTATPTADVAVILAAVAAVAASGVVVLKKKH